MERDSLIGDYNWVLKVGGIRINSKVLWKLGRFEYSERVRISI